MPEDPAGSSAGSQRREIGDAISRLTRDGAGRGPVSVRVLMDAHAVVVLMHEALTKAEQTLVGSGHVAEVMALRRAFQQTMRAQYIAEIERITGREVTTFMSTNSADPDRAAEVFLLGGSNATATAPSASARPSRDP